MEARPHRSRGSSGPPPQKLSKNPSLGSSKLCRRRTVHGFGHHGPLPSWQGPVVWRAEESRDLPSTSRILAGIAYRLLLA